MHAALFHLNGAAVDIAGVGEELFRQRRLTLPKRAGGDY